MATDQVRITAGEVRVLTDYRRRAVLLVIPQADGTEISVPLDVRAAYQVAQEMGRAANDLSGGR